MIEETLWRRRQAIVLVPEISLTAQAMALYHGRFPGKGRGAAQPPVAGERYDEWMRIARGEAQVVLGARSAIFAPCPDLGLIVIDEEHESSYKQESSPRYHAKAVALERSRLRGAPVLLASATPSLESMREAEVGRHTLLLLPERIEARPLPPVKLVDLKYMTKGARLLSAPLRQAIAVRLEAGEQTILFLNRRGFMHVLQCTKCGEQQQCPHCAVPLTYHKVAGAVRCHHCEFGQPTSLICPSCTGIQIPYRGAGTEQLEEEVMTLWPEARVGRLDRDTTAQRGAHQAIIDRFGAEETDILIGTQMVAKGHDFPRVTLVGVIAADISLGIPDFRAPERTFQLLTQVAGRAGRADLPGEVFIQTWQPKHYAVLAAAAHDYPTFYAQEVQARADAEAIWPPFTTLVNVTVTGENESEVVALAAAIGRRAREHAAPRHPAPHAGGEAQAPQPLRPDGWRTGRRPRGRTHGACRRRPCRRPPPPVRCRALRGRVPLPPGAAQRRPPGAARAGADAAGDRGAEGRTGGLRCGPAEHGRKQSSNTLSIQSLSALRTPPSHPSGSGSRARSQGKRHTKSLPSHKYWPSRDSRCPAATACRGK